MIAEGDEGSTIINVHFLLQTRDLSLDPYAKCDARLNEG